MGRYNNKRTQAAAQAAKNTPSRARFSKGPPNQQSAKQRRPPRKEEPPPKTKTRGIGGGGSTNSNQSSGRRRGGNAQTTARVIDKIQNRMGTNNNNNNGGNATTTTTTSTTTSTASASAKSTEIALNHLDTSKLDVVAVSNETQNLISDLLRELGVVGGGATTTNANVNGNNNNNNSSNQTNGSSSSSNGSQGMNPGATAFDYCPGPAIIPEEETDYETDCETDDDNDNEENDFVGAAADVDDDEDYGLLAQHHHDSSQARGVDEGGLLYEYGDDETETDAELQRVLVAARRRREEQNKNNANQNQNGGNPSGAIDEDSCVDDDDESDLGAESTEEEDDENGESEAAAALAVDPTYCHLTQTLSFSTSQAAQACRAIECWETNMQTGDDTADNKNNNNNNKDEDDDDRRLELAMDWLCLHLAQDHLERGFRPNADGNGKGNANANANTAVTGKRASVSSMATKIRAVSHPSISVISKPIAEQAKEWAEAVALQKRTLKFIRQGFHRSDCLAAFEHCGKSSSNSNSNSNSNSDNATDDPALPLLLSQLQDTAGGPVVAPTTPNNPELLERGKDDRDQELEALRAIYDDRLTVVYTDGSRSKGSPMEEDENDNDETTDDEQRLPERYILTLDPVAPLGATSESSLHVLLRDSYPAKQPPLLLLVTVPSLPPSLMRTIHSKLGVRAREVLGLGDNDDDDNDNDDDALGCPVVFELVSYLEEQLPELHNAFLREQRRKEFEAEQARMLRQQQQQHQHQRQQPSLLYGEWDFDVAGDGSAPLSRRQRAKLRAAQKAYDRPDQQKQLLEEYRRKQEARIAIARADNRASTVRANHAAQAILKRQNDMVEEDAESSARRAMSRAFREGKSTEEARAAAEAARIEAYRIHGVELSPEDGSENENEQEPEEKQQESGESATEPDTDDIHEEEPKRESTKAQSQAQSQARPTKASSEFMERLRNSAPGSSAPVTTTEQDSGDLSSQQQQQQEEEAASAPTNAYASRGRATPNTTAFMDRLREMYEKAARAKQGDNGGGGDGEKDKANDTNTNNNNNDKNNGKNKNRSSVGTGLDGYHLDDAPLEEQKKAPINRPQPVAVPSGELAGVMRDVIQQQEHQPWLVSSEARAPTTTYERATVSPAQKKREREISDRLRKELARKRKLAKEWAEANPEDEEEGGRSNSKAKGKSNNKRGKHEEKFTAQRFHEMLTVRQRLPAFQMCDELVRTIDRNQITVIAGATGCGKTTQVPQLVLDNLIERGMGATTNMIVTQPRRISAIGVSDRIAQERCEKVGETCGYSIKLEKKMSAKTRLLLCTTGVLLRRLQCDPDLAAVSHIFVDEVHERDLNTDFLIIILKDLLARRKDLKLVLMSATLNADSFSTYFGGCPVVSIPGRAHPVQENRLEDILELTGYQVEEGGDYALKTGPNKPAKISKSALRRLYHPKYSKETIHSLSIVDETVINYELLSELLEHISLNQGEGAILVFCPGFQEIQKTVEEMYKKEYFQGSNVVIYPLHSSLSTEEQVAIFEVPPPGVRKIVVSTNIAETSITIEDVVFVVDTGRVKENRRDEVNETPTLEECWVSRASAKQRRGRAGRVRPGIAYHMYSSHTHDDDMLEYQLPEMLRVGIEDLVLQILILDLGEPTSFLKKALDPPSNLALSNSLRLLEELGAVDCQWKNRKSMAFSSVKEKQKEEEDLDVSSELTALGFHLATLPVDPRVGKMMIYGALFGCVDPLLTFAAAMSARSPFVSPFDSRDQADEARKTFSVAGSDHLTILNAFNQWSELRRTSGNRVVNEFLKDNFLGRLTLFQMEDLRKQFHSLLTDIGFLPKKFRLKDMDHACNNNSQNQGLIKAVLCAGLYPNIIVAPRTVVARPGVAAKKSDKKVGENAFRSHTKGEVYLHPSTIAFDESKLDSRYCCYYELMRTKKTYVRDCTTVSPFALLLFGGTLEVFQTHGICSVDGWLKFKIDAKPATLIKYLRGKMERLLFQKIVSPQENVIESEEGRALIQSISRLFEAEEHQRKEEAARIPDRSGGEIVRPWTGMEGENERIRASQEDSNRRNRDGASRRQGNQQTGGDANRDSNGFGREGRGGRGRGRGGRGRGGRSGRGRGSRR